MCSAAFWRGRSGRLRAAPMKNVGGGAVFVGCCGWLSGALVFRTPCASVWLFRLLEYTYTTKAQNRLKSQNKRVLNKGKNKQQKAARLGGSVPFRQAQRAGKPPRTSEAEANQKKSPATVGGVFWCLFRVSANLNEDCKGENQEA